MKKYTLHPSVDIEELKKLDPDTAVRIKYTWEGAGPNEYAAASTKVKHIFKTMEEMSRVDAELFEILSASEADKIKKDFREYYEEHHKLLNDMRALRDEMWNCRIGSSSYEIIMKLPFERLQTPWSSFGKQLENERRKN